MSTPRIAPLADVLCRSGLRPEGIPATWLAEGRAFAVVGAGVFGGRAFAAGDVLVCADDDVEAPVVLAPRGHGHPRLGTLVGKEVRGEVGEPCSPERWRVAGRIVAVLRPSAALSAWCAQDSRGVGASAGRRFDVVRGGAGASAAIHGASGAGRWGDRPAPIPAGQLGLFERAPRQERAA